MGRRRYQQPNVFKTTSKRPEWFFRARVDTISVKDGQKVVTRPEKPFYLGFCDEMTKQAAKKRRDEILSELINRPQVLIPSQVKFEEIIKIYRRDHLCNLRDTSRAVQESALRTHFVELGKLRMCDIDVLAIQRWLSAMEVSYRSKQGHLNLLKLLWTKAEDWGYTQQRFPRRGSFNLGVNRPVKGRELPSMEQIRRLLAALEDPFRAMAEVALYSGLRISEIRGLQWQDITAETMTVRRRISALGGVDVPKSMRGYRVFDVRPLAGVFQRLPRKSEWVFGRQGTGYSSCMQTMQAARAAAGITVALFGWHHLRAIFNTLARNSGADAADRQALMGHSSERTNAIYIMQAEGDLKRRGDLMLAVQGTILGEAKGVQ